MLKFIDIVFCHFITIFYLVERELEVLLRILALILSFIQSYSKYLHLYRFYLLLFHTVKKTNKTKAYYLFYFISVLFFVPGNFIFPDI